MAGADRVRIKAWTRDRLAAAARAGVAPALDRLALELRQAVRSNDQRLDGLQAGVDRLGGRVDALADEVSRHSPRPDGRPEFLARYHLSDVLAWRAADTSAAWVEEHLLQASVYATREDNLRAAARSAPASGLILEFGVGHGESLEWLHAEAGGRRVVGFDSFEGLPEAWRTGFDQGAFSDADPSPRRELVVGWFDDTLPTFLAETDEQIALLHVDCDLYSSTVTVLTECLPRIAPGGVVVFDEFLNYPGWMHHEAKAWWEAVEAFGLNPEYTGYVPSWEQVTARL